MGDQRCVKCGAAGTETIFSRGYAETHVSYHLCVGHLAGALVLLGNYAAEASPPPYPICAYSNADYKCGDRAEWEFWDGEAMVPACPHHLAAMLPHNTACIIRLQGIPQ